MNTKLRKAQQLEQYSSEEDTVIEVKGIGKGGHQKDLQIAVVNHSGQTFQQPKNVYFCAILSHSYLEMDQ